MQERNKSVPEKLIRDAILAGRSYTSIIAEYHCSGQRVALVKRKLEQEARGHD
jgi:hypothetical protein